MQLIYNWNTLCLPFSLSTEQLAASPLAGAEKKTLVSSEFNNNTGTLSLNFTADADNLTSIVAGKPYIIKWEKAPDYQNTNEYNLYEPTFTNVTIADSNNPVAPTSDC